MKFTYGWGLMLVVVFVALFFRYRDAKDEGRLDDGIDPVWMRETRADSAAKLH
jgi:arabinofuranan 3-O-arabinosyltransferase